MEVQFYNPNMPCYLKNQEQAINFFKPHSRAVTKSDKCFISWKLRLPTTVLPTVGGEEATGVEVIPTMVFTQSKITLFPTSEDGNSAPSTEVYTK